MKFQENEMSHYIVCHKKRNNPRMNVRICQKKCHLRHECQEYIAYQKINNQDKNDMFVASESQYIEIAVT
jgi:hypothetical protein